MSETNKRCLAGDVIDIEVAFIPKDISHPGFYGDRDLKNCAITKNTAQLVTIELFSGKKRQAHQLLILLPGERFVVLEEWQHLLLQPDG